MWQYNNVTRAVYMNTTFDICVYNSVSFVRAHVCHCNMTRKWRNCMIPLQWCAYNPNVYVVCVFVRFNITSFIRIFLSIFHIHRVLSFTVLRSQSLVLFWTLAISIWLPDSISLARIFRALSPSLCHSHYSQLATLSLFRLPRMISVTVWVSVFAMLYNKNMNGTIYEELVTHSLIFVYFNKTTNCV